MAKQSGWSLLKLDCTEKFGGDMLGSVSCLVGHIVVESFEPVMNNDDMVAF